MTHAPLHEGDVQVSGYMDYMVSTGEPYRAEIVPNPTGPGYGFRHTSYRQKTVSVRFGPANILEAHRTEPADVHFDTRIEYRDPDNNTMCATIFVGRQNKIRWKTRTGRC